MYTFINALREFRRVFKIIQKVIAVFLHTILHVFLKSYSLYNILPRNPLTTVPFPE